MKSTLILLSLVAMLAGCASKGPSTASYDLGPLGMPLRTMSTPAMPALIVSDVSGPVALDSQRMYYRLLYADPRQARPYAYNNWNATPLHLLSHRFKTRIAQSGLKVVSTSDAAGGLPLLRLEVEEFMQNYDSPTGSHANVTVRASLFRQHKLIDQRSFSRSTPAPTPDAAGGAQALADSSDAIATDILNWLATQPQP